MWKKKKKAENIHFLPTDKIYPNPWQARRNFDNETLASLAQSIARYGVLEPITVRKQGPDWELLMGERRLRAAKLLGLEEIPCRIADVSPKTGAELALIENLMREDLDFFEEAEAIDRLLKNFHYTQAELAAHLSQSQSTVANKLRLLRLNSGERLLIAENALSERHARALVRISDSEGRMFALKYIIEKNYNVRQTDAFIDALLASPEEFFISLQPKLRPAKPARKPVVRDVRLFCNSVDRAISGIREAGFDLIAEKQDENDFISYIIRIPKSIKKA